MEYGGWWREGGVGRWDEEGRQEKEWGSEGEG